MNRLSLVALLLVAGCGALPSGDRASIPAEQVGRAIDLLETSDPTLAGQNNGQTDDPSLIDEDRDGLSLEQELRHGTSDSTSDSDDDGLSDYEEIRTYQTDPTNPDTDSDGLTDFEEVVTFGTSPFRSDSDFDGVSDFDETSIYQSDPWSAYSDADNLRDGLEVLLGTDPTNPDTDGDGISDYEEFETGTDPLDAADPPPFVRGSLFSFLARQETKALRALDAPATLRAAQAGAICLNTRRSELAGNGTLGGGAELQAICACAHLAEEAVIEGFEGALLKILDQIGYVMNSSDRREVSKYMHDRFDGVVRCSSSQFTINCTWVSSLCAW